MCVMKYLKKKRVVTKLLIKDTAIKKTHTNNYKKRTA